MNDFAVVAAGGLGVVLAGGGRVGWYSTYEDGGVGGLPSGPLADARALPHRLLMRRRSASWLAVR